MNFICVYGAAIALIMLIPPACSAGKNLTTSRPRRSPSRHRSDWKYPELPEFPYLQYLTTVGFKPGLTMNFAPAFTARSTCSVVRTVPAPTNISGNSFAIIRMDSSAAAVRNVTSAHGRPPSQSAFASGAASFASSNYNNWNNTNFLDLSKTSFMIPVSFFAFINLGNSVLVNNQVILSFNTWFHNAELSFALRYHLN